MTKICKVNLHIGVSLVTQQCQTCIKHDKLCKLIKINRYQCLSTLTTLEISASLLSETIKSEKDSDHLLEVHVEAAKHR